MIVSRGIEKVRVADDQLGEEQGGVDQPSPSGENHILCFGGMIMELMFSFLSFPLFFSLSLFPFLFF